MSDERNEGDGGCCGCAMAVLFAVLVAVVLMCVVSELNSLQGRVRALEQGDR